MTRVSVQVVGAHRIDINVDDNGNFSAEFNDQDFSAKTKADLVEKLTKAVKRADAQGVVDVTVLGLVPLMPGKGSAWRGRGEHFEQGAGFVNAKLRGQHERSYHTYLLVSEAGIGYKAGVKFQVSGSREGVICRRIDLQEGLRYMELLEAKRTADTALEDFIGLVKIDVDETLAAARKKEK